VNRPLVKTSFFVESGFPLVAVMVGESACSDFSLYDTQSLSA